MKRFLFLVAAAVALVGSAAAQQLSVPALPLDPAVRMGKLENGLTYYIRHNEWPEQRADFYIAQKVGSMQEEDDQRGLAHFLEHMCFNGTTHFPGNGLKTYLETIGVKFGQDLNAYTSFDETVYNINNVPVISNPAAIDSCLLILHDWSHDLLLEGDEIDKERGVINEEWRMRSSAQQRMLEAGLPIILEGSKYANRMPIGTMDVVMNFPHQAIRDYYKKWYRPDLQAIVVVGDVDVDAVEAKIKTMFADIKAVENAAERVAYPVPDNSEPIFCLMKDKEQDRSTMQIIWKHEPLPDELKPTIMSYMTNYIVGAIDGMLGMRLAEITMQENPPFLGAQIEFNNEYVVAKTKDACTVATAFKEGEHKPAIEAAYRELLRAKRFGFTAAEYERYKENFRSSIENMYERRNKIGNSNYVDEYVRHFLDQTPAPGIEWEHENMLQLCDQITIDMINQTVMQEEECAPVIVSFMPDKEGIQYPTKEEVLGIMKAVEAEEIEGYKEEVSDEPLLDITALKGSKIKKETAADYGFTKLTLKNGIDIYVKKTDFAPNNITMRAMSWGGNSLYSEKDYLDADNAENISLGGWGNFSAIELSKKLSGKKANVSPSIGTRDESMSGNCVTKDFETMLQLTYLAFTSPRKDEEVFRSTMSRTKTSLMNAELQPTTALQDTITSVVYNNNIRAQRTKPEDIDRMNYDNMLRIYRERFADANDFTFFFIGDIDIEAAKPLFELYLGSLPVLKSKETYKTVDLRISKGERKNVFEKEQETPNAVVLFLQHAPMEMTMKNSIAISMLKQILQMEFTESVREDEGGAYSVGVAGNLSEYPEKYAVIQVQLPTAPEKRERMTEIIYQGLDHMAEVGPKAEDLQKVKEYMLRSYDEQIKSNGYWLGAITNKVIHKRDFITGYTDAVNAMTTDDIRDFAAKIIKSGNRIEVGMTSPKE